MKDEEYAGLTFIAVGAYSLGQCVLILLKFLHILQWRWIWILSPTWIAVLFCWILVIVLGIVLKTLNKRKVKGKK